jgi:hypothetical protein
MLGANGEDTKEALRPDGMPLQSRCYTLVPLAKVTMVSERSLYIPDCRLPTQVLLNGLTSNGVEPSTVGSQLPLMRAWRPEHSRMMVRAPEAATISRLSHAIQL